MSSKNTSQVDALLAKPVRKAQRIKTSFNLDKSLFDGFRTLCEERDLAQSELLDAMLADVLARYKAEKPNQ